MDPLKESKKFKDEKIMKTNALITNQKKAASLKKRLQELITYSEELKFLVGFFYPKMGTIPH